MLMSLRNRFILSESIFFEMELLISVLIVMNVIMMSVM